ncbi:MAG: hypothetical protein ABI999_05285 [Acidobacteriota bacterium]
MLHLCKLIAAFAFVVVGLTRMDGQAPPAPAKAADAPRPISDKDKGPTTKDKIARWFDIEQLTAATRYHFIENDNKTKGANNFQYQFIGKFRFKFDKKGKYSIDTNLATGPSFISFWNASGWGTGAQVREFNLRQLYFDAKPYKAVEVQFGGLAVNFGDNTEAITYDNDNYITGARVQIRAPKKVYFDEISLTTATLADINRPDIFHRMRHLDVQNYRQFLVRKQVNKVVSITGDYTFESGIDTFHQAIKIKLPPRKLIDTFLFENYERVDPDRSYGFNIFGEKKLNKIFTTSGGFADIHIRAFNGDRFPPGKRFYFTGQAKLLPEITLMLQLTQAVGPIGPNIARSRVDFTVTYNILASLKRTKLFG